MKRLTVVISMVTLFALAGAAGAEITIGVNFSTTGPAASLGIQNKNAISFAPAVIAGEKVRYVILDMTPPAIIWTFWSSISTC